MSRDKYRFRRLFRLRLWWELYYSEFRILRSSYYEDGGSTYDTREEYEAAFKRRHKIATQYANECLPKGAKP